jgi:hypothetical protein
VAPAPRCLIYLVRIAAALTDPHNAVGEKRRSSQLAPVYQEEQEAVPFTWASNPGRTLRRTGCVPE